MLAILLCATLTASPDGQIAYLAGNTSDERRLTVMDVASREILFLGPGGSDGPPSWSPDGEWLAFNTESSTGRVIYVTRFDGSDGRYLRHAHLVNRSPAWAADGSRLAYVVGRGPERQIAVYTLATDTEVIWGGRNKGLTSPKWLSSSLVESLSAPDETDLAGLDRVFNTGSSELIGLVAVGMVGESMERSSATDIFLVTEHETTPFPTIALPSAGAYAEWNAVPAHRAHAIAFESDDGGDRELFLNSRRGVWDLSNHRAADWNPVWSPDDSWLAFESFRSGTRGIYRVHRDTARVYPVALSDAASNWWPSWSPRGQWIAYVSDRDSTSHLFITDIKGRETIQLTQGIQGAAAPTWRPAR